MKKSIKILTLVLSLALICGALVVAAFAEGETEIKGIRYDVSADMEGIEELTGSAYDAVKGTYPNIPAVTSGFVEVSIDRDPIAAAALAFKHQVGGVPKFVQNPVDQNHYVTVDWGTETSTQGHFLHAYVKNGWGTYNSTNSGVEFLDDFQYFVADFDISFFDPANFSGGSFTPYVTRAKAAVDKDGNPTVSRNDIDSNFQVSFAKANDLVYTHFSSSGDQKAVIGDGSSWHHVTYILGAQTFDDNGDENIKVNMYLAVDGKIIATKTWTNDLSDADSFQNDRTQIGIMGVRLDAFGKSGSSGNVDNVVYRTLTKDYNGNLASVLEGGIGTNLTAWESNIYDADNMPYGIHAAMLGETPYETLQGAVDAANAGDTITLCANVPVKVTINKPLTINCGAYTLATPNVEGAYAGELNAETGIYEVKAYTGFKYTKSGVTYTTANLSTAISGADSGTTINMYGDVEYTITADIATGAKALTFDLNGGTLKMSQSKQAAIVVNTTKLVTFKNGTVVTGANSSYPGGSATASYTFVSVTATGATVNFENINSYVSALVFSYGNPYNVNIKGGEHHVVNKPLGMNTNGFICGQANIQAKVEDANIFIAADRTKLIGSTSYRQVYNLANKKTNFDAVSANDYAALKSNFVFTDCTIAGETATQEIFGVMNEHATVAFNNCDIFGKLTATHHGSDKTIYCVKGTDDIILACVSICTCATPSDTTGDWKCDNIVNKKACGKYIDTTLNENSTYTKITQSFGAAKPGSITLGTGTWYSNAVSTGSSEVVAPAADCFVFGRTASIDVIFSKSSGNIYNGDFAVSAPATVTNVYTTQIASLDELLTENTSAGCNFTITTPGGEVYYTDDIFLAFAIAPAGSTVDFNKDFYIVADSVIATIRNALTINLNGHTLGISQSAQVDTYIKIDTTEPVVINGGNGMIVSSNNKNSGITGDGRAFPTFTTDKAVNFTLNNVNTAVGAILYNISGNGAKLTVNGGEHYGFYVVQKTDERGIVVSRANIDVVFNDAKIYMNYMSALAASWHTATTSGTKLSTFTYNNCYIVQQDANHSLIRQADADSYFYFNNSYVYGLFTRRAGSGKYTGANLIFGEGSAWGSSGKTPDTGNYGSGDNNSNYTAADFTVAEGFNSFVISDSFANKYTKFVSGSYLNVTSDDKFADTSANTFKTTAKNSSSYTYTFTVFSGDAEDNFDVKYIKDGKTCYASGPNALKTAITNADADADVTDDVATIVLLNDISINLTADLSISKNITIDLGGKTIYLAQSAQAGFAPTTGISFKLMNGTVCVAAEDAYNNNKTDMQTHAIVANIGSNAKVYYKDVNTYGYAITYSWGNPYSVFVDGGEHHMYTAFDNLTYAGWICGNHNITADVRNATIYLEYSAAYLVGFQNYKAVAAGITPKSTASFYNCTIVDTETTAGIIKGLNKYSTVKFEKCDIFGKIAPGATNDDAAADKSPVDGSITIGAGCRLTDATKGNAVVALGAGAKFYDNDVTVTLNVNKASGLWNTDEFAITSTTQEVTFNLVDPTTVSGVDFVFEYVKDGITYWTPETGTDTIADVLTNATAGSTIKLLRDYTWKGTKIKYVQRDYTLDLGGFTLTHQQSFKNNYTSSYLELQNGTFTIKNGTIRAMLVDAEGNDTGKNYPFIRMSYSSAVYKSITLNVENVNTYGGTFIYNMNALSATINITGGEHYLTNSFEHVKGTFIEARANVNVTISGAYFYVSSKSNGIIASMSYQEVNSNKNLTPIVDESGNLIGWEGIENSFTFNDCQIFSEDTGKSIVLSANEYTTIEFNNCKIIGSVNPVKDSWDGNQPKYYFDYVDGKKTYHSGAGCSCKTFTDEDGNDACDTCNKPKSMIWAIGGPKEGSITFDIGTTYLKSATLKYVAFKAGLATSEGSIEIVFTDPTFGTKTATGTIVKVGGDVSVAIVTVVFNGTTTNYETFLEAIQFAPAGATINVLRDISIVVDSQIIIDKALTIELGGYHLQIIQNAKNAQIFIRTLDEVVFKNGRISCAASNDLRKTFGYLDAATYDGGMPLFVADTVAANLKLDGISTYTAGIFHNKTSGSVLTVNGGYHQHTASTKEAPERGMVIAEAGITSTFNNANVYMDYVGALLLGLSLDNMTFTYNNCKVVTADGDHRFIRVANDKTFVYFNSCEVYGAFAQPTNNGIGGAFTSANLHFGKDTTWGYTGTLDGKNVVMPTIPEGCYFIGVAENVIAYDSFAISGTFYKNTFSFAAATPTNTNYKTAYLISDESDIQFSLTANGKTEYYNITIAEIINKANAVDNAVIKFYQDYKSSPTGWIDIKKSITFDLNNHKLTLVHAEKNATLRSGAKDINIIFENGEIEIAPGATSGAYATNTFCFLYVIHNINVEFNNVNGKVSTLVFVYSQNPSIKLNGGTYTLNTNSSDLTTGFISTRSNVEVEINDVTIFVEKSSIISAESYNEANNKIKDNKNQDIINSVAATLKSSFVFNNCKIIANNATTNVLGRLNKHTTVTFNDCYIHGSLVPAYGNNDKSFLTYVWTGDKYVVSPAKCTCNDFTDNNGDGKCDNVLACTTCKGTFVAGEDGKCSNYICTTCKVGLVDSNDDGKCDKCGSGYATCGAAQAVCGKYDPAEIKTYVIEPATAANVIIGAGTRFSSVATITPNSVFSEYVFGKIHNEKIEVGGFSYFFDCIADYAYVIWYDENGNELKRVQIDGNLTDIAGLAPKYEGKGGVTNGWYKVGGYKANSWTLIRDNTEDADLSNLDLTKDVALYPQANGDQISAYLTAAMYNLSITGAIRNNFYIPKTPDNVTILGVYVNDKAITGWDVLYRDHKGTPVPYTMYVIGEVGATEFTEVTNVVVKYTVNGLELEQSYNISPKKYVQSVYNSASNYNTEALNVVADLVRYSYLLSIYAKIDAEELEAITDLYNKMNEYCSDLPSDNAMAGSTTNVSNLAGVGQIQYEASSYEPRWKFTFNASAEIVDVKITLQGFHNGFLNDRTNFGTKTYGVEQVTKDANGYITIAYTENIPVYNIVQVFTITLTKADGSIVEGTYDLKSYYTAVLKNTDAAEFIKSVVALANSTVAYKFPEGKITTNDVADFWECDHEGATAVESDVNYADYNFMPRLCNKCDSYLFYYGDYGAKANGTAAYGIRSNKIGGTNDYEAIYLTHKNANEWANNPNLNEGKRTAVVGNFEPTVVKNYYISLPEDKNGATLPSITIATDTSWNGVYWIIDDNAICNAGSSCKCGRYHNNYYKQNIFQVDEYGRDALPEDWSTKITSIDPGATNIGYAPGRKMLVYIENSEHKIWYRYGSNASNGVSASEVILVDEFGNIDPTTPIQWNYTKLSSIKAYSVDTDPIKISGLDANGNINSFFESYVNNDPSQNIPSYTSCARNITILRSNATVEGIHRYFTEEVSDGAGDNVERFAYTFIVVQWCHNPTVKDMIVRNHNSEHAEDDVSQGSYEFSGSDANAISWINCKTVNMFSSDVYGSTDVTPYVKYRGLFGTNRLRNMYLKDCFLNSFDAHTGACNVTIEDSTFDHMNFVGGGQINIKNVTIYTSKAEYCAINLRSDYGSIWQGDLDIDGLTIKYGNVSEFKPAQITLFKGTYEKDHYYGRDTYMPQNVTINNFHTQAYTATVTDGVRDEKLVATDDSNMKVYYYHALHSLNTISAKSEPGQYKPMDEKNQKNYNLDCGENHLEVTKNLTITNSVKIELPTGLAWKDMNVTVDGTKKTYLLGYWY